MVTTIETDYNPRTPNVPPTKIITTVTDTSGKVISTTERPYVGGVNISGGVSGGEQGGGPGVTSPGHGGGGGGGGSSQPSLPTIISQKFGTYNPYTYIYTSPTGLQSSIPFRNVPPGTTILWGSTSAGSNLSGGGISRTLPPSAVNLPQYGGAYTSTGKFYPTTNPNYLPSGFQQGFANISQNQLDIIPLQYAQYAASTKQGTAVTLPSTITELEYSYNEMFPKVVTDQIPKVTWLQKTGRTVSKVLSTPGLFRSPEGVMAFEFPVAFDVPSGSSLLKIFPGKATTKAKQKFVDKSFNVFGAKVKPGKEGTFQVDIISKTTLPKKPPIFTKSVSIIKDTGKGDFAVGVEKITTVSKGSNVKWFQSKGVDITKSVGAGVIKDIGAIRQVTKTTFPKSPFYNFIFGTKSAVSTFTKDVSDAFGQIARTGVKTVKGYNVRRVFDMMTGKMRTIVTPKEIPEGPIEFSSSAGFLTRLNKNELFYQGDTGAKLRVPKSKTIRTEPRKGTTAEDLVGASIRVGGQPKIIMRKANVKGFIEVVPKEVTPTTLSAATNISPMPAEELKLLKEAKLLKKVQEQAERAVKASLSKATEELKPFFKSSSVQAGSTAVSESEFFGRGMYEKTPSELVTKIPIEKTTLDLKMSIDKTFADKVFADKTFIDKAFIDKTFIDKTYIDKTFADKTFIDKAFIDKTFIDKTFVDKSFMNKAFADKAFTEKAFIKARLAFARPRPTTTTIVPIPKIKSKSQTKKSKGSIMPKRPTGFQVVSFRQKKPFLVSPRSLPAGEALALGVKFTKKTERASFKLVPSNEPARSIGIKPLTPAEVYKAGYRPPVKGSKFKTKTNIFIQRRPTRMGTRPEVRAIQGYRKRKSIW